MEDTDERNSFSFNNNTDILVERGSENVFPSEKMNSALEGMFQWGYRCSTIERSLRLTIVYSSIRHFQVSL